MRERDLMLLGACLWAVAFILELGGHQILAMVPAVFGSFVLGFRDGRYGGKSNA